jgi:multidrug efflux pump subunit AcrB
MPQFFIDRPVFAWVIAIIITLGGVLAIRTLPAEAYPDVAPPQVSINATYPGANADTVERTVIQVIVDNLQKIGPGMPVKAKPATAEGPEAPAAPAAPAENPSGSPAPATAS